MVNLFRPSYLKPHCVSSMMAYQLSMSICSLTHSEKSNRVTFNSSIYWDCFFCFVLLSVISFHSIAVAPNPVLCIIAQSWMIWFWTCLLTIIHADVELSECFILWLTSWIFFESSFLSYTLWLIKQKLASCTEKYSASRLVSVCLDSPYPLINRAMNHWLIASVSFWPPLDLFQTNFGQHSKWSQTISDVFCVVQKCMC